MKDKKWWIIAGAAILVVFGVAYWWISYLKNTPAVAKPALNHSLSQDELVAVTRPSVVRIAQHIEGEARVPNFSIDVDSFRATFDYSTPPRVIPIKSDLLGSGFIINTDGYILTNSHVVSRETVKRPIIAQLVSSALIRGSYAGIIKAKLEGRALDAKTLTAEEQKEIANRIIGEVMVASQFSLTKKVTVLNPASYGQSLTELVDKGFPARILSVNDDFFDDDEDIALIKIDATNLPTFALQSKGVALGERLGVFGYPASADFRGTDLLVPTYTQGNVSAEKDSQEKSFKIMQTDAKISQGSSGGPVFNDLGEAVGIIAFQTSIAQQRTGDSFAFALPLQLMERVVQKNKVSDATLPDKLVSGDYALHFRRGLDFLEAGQGNYALAEFAAAKKTHEDFSTIDYVSPYIKKAEELIASGQSIDTRWDETVHTWREIPYYVWILVGLGALIVVSGIVAGLIFMKRMKKDETEMHSLEQQLPQLSHDTPESPISFNPKL